MRLALICTFVVLAGATRPLLAQSPTGAMGQQQQTIGANQSIMAAMLAPTTGLPYKAVKVTRSVQRLGDGTVITHETKGLFARDNEGRVREDLYVVHSGQYNAQQVDGTLLSATVGDPVAHTMIFWTNQDMKVAMKMALPSVSGAMATALAAPPPPPPPPTAPSPSPARPVTLSTLNKTNGDEVHTEQLGRQSIEGVLATGTRTTTTIPVGKIGNDRPMTIVHEEWRSSELKILIKTTDSDPRTGEQTMELTELVRTDPDEELFQAPAGFKIVDMADMMKTFGNIGKK